MSTYRPIAPILTEHDYYGIPITALTFDTVSDTLWTGNNVGSVVAYYSTQGSRGVKFPVGGDHAVKKVISGDQYVRALGSAGHGVGSWSKGGVNKWYYQPKSSQPVLSFSNNISATPNIAVSTSAPELILVNSATGSVVRHATSISTAMHIVSSHSQLVVGFADGWVRTYDGRSAKFGEHSEASVKSHSKGIQGLEVSGNYAFTIGWGARQGRQIPDPIVKVYDLRKLQPLPPVSFSTGPGFINTLPRRSSSIVVTSPQGLVTIVDASNPGAIGEFYQLDVPTYITSVAVSSTGVYLAFGDSEGTIHLMTAAEEAAVVPFNGFEGQPVEWADIPEPLPELDWTASTPLNAIGMPRYDSLLLSSWSPQFLPATPHYPPAAKIPPQILSSMKVNEFVGYAALPKELQGRRNVVAASPREFQGRFRSGKFRSKDMVEPTTPTSEYSLQEIPKAYRRVEIEYSKFGVEDFDFAFYNRTEYSGLETHIMNSYTNALVQTLHYVEPVHRLATSHITTNCTTEHCLLCELGFVSRMLSDARGTNCQASNFCRTVGALAQGANLIGLIDFGRHDADYSHMIQSFHRFLLDQLSSEGNAFPHNPRIVPLHPGSQPSDTLAAAPVTQLLGIIAKNVIICGSCKAVREKENMTHVVDLVYPRRGIHNAENNDFASILRNSLIREMSHKATCQTCKQFSGFDARRNIPSRDLPPILAVNASAYNEENLRFWHDQRQGPFLQPAVEIRGQVDGIDDAMLVRYELRSIVVQVTPREKALSPHLVSIVKVRDAEGQADLKSPWFVFNDFVVTNVTQSDALGFSDAWKTPSILYFERVDMRDKLDYRELPVSMDLSILQLDIQHFPNNRDPGAIKHEPLSADELPRVGTLVSIDAEFVSMQQEETEFKSDGTKKVLRPARLSLARVSVLRGDGPKQGVPFIDDHIHTSEIVVDYLTEFSGINPGDLDPVLSRHTLVPLKVAYKKLRVLVDCGCIFIGHGLAKDFRIINIFVPPDRVIDTVDVYHLEARHRKLSLRFLSWAVLKQYIQTDTHDSIEDARCALLLYKAFQEFEEDGIFDEKLEELYRIGKQHNWKPPALPGAHQSPPPQLQQQILPAHLQYLVGKQNLLTAFMLSPQAQNSLLQQQQRQFMDEYQMPGRSMSSRSSGRSATSPPHGSMASLQPSWRRGQR